MLLPRFVHFLGIALWIGGALSVVVMVQGLKARTVSYRVSTWPLLARIHGLVIAPGAVLTVVSGFLMTIQMTNDVATPAATGVVVMQGTGVVAAVIALFVGLPTANQLALFDRMDEFADLPPEAVRLAKRQAVASSLSGVLALTALYFGIMVR